MSYNPLVKVYYGPFVGSIADQYRLSPAPTLTITTNLKYANDNVIGYDYTVVLNGFITALDRTISQTDTSGLNVLKTQIDKFTNILHFNGGLLSVVDKNNNNILKARGGILQNFNIDESDNIWINYAPYSATFKFSEIEYFGCSETESIACTGLIYEPTDYNSSFVDISKYKIDSFSDNWSFDLNDQNISNRYSDLHNESIDLTYEISAQGRLFFDQDKLLPAWEQARNFVQDRLHEQVTSLISKILNKANASNDGCLPEKTIDTLHEIEDSDNGIINLLGASYKVFNESITCKTGESQGTFAATYRSVIKKINNSDISTENSSHSYTVNKTINNGQNKSVSLVVEGNIQGLVPGGIINNPTAIQLPANGQIFIVNQADKSTKYDHALAAYNKISNGEDLSNTFKAHLNIDYSALNIDDKIGVPKSSNHTVNHTYADGSISYTTTYNSEISCLDNTYIRNISISKNDPTPRIAEFIVPGRSGGPIIQRIGSDSPRTIGINITGYSKDIINCCFELDQIVGNICNESGLLPSSGIPSGMPPDGGSYPQLILSADNYTSNILDGSFSIQRQYICCDSKD